MKYSKSLVGLMLLALAAPAVHAMTADEIIAKNVEAKGGKAAWQAIESIKMTGDFTAFSKVNPFTLHRKRDNLYHLDHRLGDELAIIGYDGEIYWWENTFFQEGATKVTGEADLAVLLRDIEFETPMLTYPENGFEITVSEETELEGEAAIALSIDRGDGSEETWYLNPETYLEFARVSPGSDFGRPMPQTTYFEDFRDVNGAMVPHFTETQWYTRDRVMEVHAVEVNLEIDDALFRLPPVLGMEILQHLAGSWEVAVQSKENPQAEEFAESTRSTTIEPLLGGALLQEMYTGGDGTESVRTITYDRFRKHYLITHANEQTTYLDLQHSEGFDDDGRLLATNEQSGTTLDMFGMSILMSTAISDVTPESFYIENSISMDGGENWLTMEKLTYTRAE